MNSEEELVEYGPVKIIKGKYKGAIGYFDYCEKGLAYVYLGNMAFVNYIVVPVKSLSDDITIYDLKERKQFLRQELFKLQKEKDYNFWALNNLHEELHLVEDLLHNKYFDRYVNVRQLNKRVFISHSSADTQLAIDIAVDLGNEGINAWLDKWDIKLGHSIPKEISVGLEESDAIIILYSKNYKDSTYCNDEWEAFYTKFNKLKPNGIIPILIDDIEPPTMIGARKYFKYNNMFNEYDALIYEIVRALKG